MNDERDIEVGDRYVYRGETYVVTAITHHPPPAKVELAHITAEDRGLTRKPTTLSYSVEWERQEAACDS